MEDFTLLWNEYYPIVVTALIAIGGFIGTVYLVYTQVSKIVSPIMDKISEWRDKDDAVVADKSIVESINFDVLKIDLKAKIENTTISPELTALYEAQLAKLEAITSVATDTIATAEALEDKYL